MWSFSHHDLHTFIIGGKASIVAVGFIAKLCSRGFNICIAGQTGGCKENYLVTENKVVTANFTSYLSFKL